MERTTFINTVVPAIKNGTYTRLVIRRSLAKDLKAAHRDVDIVKESIVVARLGVRYSHIATVAQNIIASGLDPKNIDLELPWGEWDPECPYLIAHKGNYYLRCTHSKNPYQKPKARYFLNGAEISKAELQALGYLRDSYWNKTEPEEVFNYNLADVVSIG